MDDRRKQARSNPDARAFSSIIFKYLADFRWAEFTRYAVVGLSQNAASYLAFLLLTYSGLRGWQAMAILYPLAVCITFLVNRSWSFATKERSTGQFLRYISVYVGAYPISIGFLWALEFAGTPSWLAGLMTIGATAVLIFLGLNFWVFSPRRA